MPVYWDAGRKRYRVRVWKHGRKHEVKMPAGATKDEADLEEARLRLDLDARPRGEARAVPAFSDVCLQYAVHGERMLAADTYRNRRLQLDVLSRHLGDLRVTAITSSDLERFVVARRSDVRVIEKPGPEGTTIKTTRPAPGPGKIRDDLKVLRVVLGWAQERGYLQTIPDFRRAVRSLRVEGRQRRVRAWTRDQIAGLLKASAEVAPSILPLVVFLVNTGCRKTEAIRLRSRSVDLAAGVLWIEPSEEWRPKSGKARAVPISPALRRWLSEDRLAGEHVFTWRREPKKGQPPAPPKPWAMWPQRFFDRARRKAGLTGGPHTLRHTYASEFLAAGGSMWELAQILGHSEQRTTALYSHFRPDQVAAAANRVSIDVGAAEEARGKWATVPRSVPPRREAGTTTARKKPRRTGA